MSRNYVLLGPQGSGKGTQAHELAKLMGIPHISTGEIFRDHVARVSELGKIVSELLKAGSLVPDEITNKVVADRLTQPDAKHGFILDGYPRNVNQAEYLAGINPLVTAIYLSLTDDEAVKRIAGRRTCPSCGAVYHIKFKPPRVGASCDLDGRLLIQRNDDAEPVVRERLAAFHRQTEPLLDFYRKRRLLMEVDGAPPISQVTSELRRLLDL